MPQAGKCQNYSGPLPNSTPFTFCCQPDLLTPDRILGRRSPLWEANESFLPVTQTVVNHTPLSSSRERLPLESFPSETEIYLEKSRQREQTTLLGVIVSGTELAFTCTLWLREETPNRLIKYVKSLPAKV